MPATPTILLTGFEPFGGEAVNPAGEIVRMLEGALIAGHRVVGAVLPVEFAATLPRLAQLLDAHQPALALALGQAGGRSALSFERVAVNLIDARIADNAGAQPFDVPVVADGPSAWFTNLPVKAMVAQLAAVGIPATVSLTAGSFVCNQVFYALTQLGAARRPVLRSGFLHVPWLPEQAVHRPGEPSMALVTMVEGVRLALECALATTHDLAQPGGATH